MSPLSVQEGHIPFAAGIAERCETYYKKFYNSTREGQHGSALVVVHGGPAFGHDYLLPLQQLASMEPFGCVIFYDQIGCGKSTHPLARKGDPSFWNLDLLRRELENLLQHLEEIAPGSAGRYHLLGHSTGALVAALFAATRPAGLQKLLLSNGFASWELFGRACLEIIGRYPSKIQDSIIETEEFALGRRSQCNVSPEEYQAALAEYRKDYCLRRPREFPEDYVQTFQNLQGGMDSWIGFAGGVVEIIWGGSLASETAIPVLGRIKVPTLVLNGEWDKASAVCSQPLADLIPGATRVVLNDTSHMPQFEEPAAYLASIREFVAA